MSERRGYRVEDRRRVIPLEHRVNRHTSINPNTRRHKQENTPSIINERPETKAWNFAKNILPTGGNVGRYVGNYLSDIFGIGSLANKTSFYRGGSPGPRTRQKLQPRAKDFKGLAPYNPDRKSEYFKGPYEPDFTKEPTQPWNLMPGLGMIEKGKDIYNKFRPELNDDMLNWKFGNWNFGVGKDKVGFGYNLPLGGTSMRPFKEGIESLTDSPDYSDFYMDKIIRDNPEEVLYNLMRQNPTPEMQEYYDQPIDRYQLDFGGPEIDKWIEENPGSTMGDLLDILPELGKTGPQPGDFWPGGAEI